MPTTGNPPLDNIPTSETFSSSSPLMLSQPGGPKVAPPSLIAQPAAFDVLLGRGKNVQHHSGNERLRLIVSMYKARHDAAPARSDKTAITQDVVRMITTSGSPPGRFLRFDSDANAWVEIEDAAARLKVSMAFRYKTKVTTNAAGKRQRDSESAPEVLVNGKPSADSDGYQSDIDSSYEPLKHEESESTEEQSDPQQANKATFLLSDEAILQRLGYSYYRPPSDTQTQDEEAPT